MQLHKCEPNYYRLKYAPELLIFDGEATLKRLNKLFIFEIMFWVVDI